jgi:cytoskeletal protein CcmA (bactofilin family)
MAKTSESPNCTIGEGSIFEGKFFVNGSILIEGKFKGEIKTNEELIVGPSGRVRTDITARRVTVAGTVIGNITASEEVNLVQTGKVLGDITTPRLNVEQGVVTEGQVTITAGKGESIRRLVEEAYGPETADEFKTLLNEKPSGRKGADKSGSDG